MSNIPVNVVPVLEPRVDFGSNENSHVEGFYAMVLGGVTYTYRNYPSNSCDNSGANWNTQPPSYSDVLSRIVVLELPINLQFSGPGSSNPDEAMLESNLDAFRAFPIESIIKTLTVTLNGTALTVNMNQVVHPFSRYHLGVDKINNGITPNMLDNFANYSDADGNAKNPLAWYDNSAQNPRGSYFDYEIVTNTNTSAEVRAVLRSYIMLSPFQWLSARDNNVAGLTQLVSLDWNITFAQNLARVWSRSDAHPVPVSNLQVTIGSSTGGGNGNANLRLLWISPKPNDRSIIERMPEIKYPYFNTTRWTTTGSTTLAPNATDEITSQVINFKNIPNAIYVYAIQEEASYQNTLNGNLTVTDTYFNIENIDITMQNITGILSSATPVDLYNICVKNGLQNTTFSEFYGTTNPFNQLVSTFVAGRKVGLTGSCIRLEPGIDISLPDNMAPGVGGGTIDFQIKVRVRNINQTRNIRPQLCILAVYEGYIRIYNGQCSLITGPLTPGQVLAVDSYAKVHWDDLQDNFGGASNLGDRFRSFSRRIPALAQSANRFLRDSQAISKGLKVASYLPTRFSSSLSAASNVADKYGYGMDGGVLIEDQRGGRMMSHDYLKSKIGKRN